MSQSFRVFATFAGLALTTASTAAQEYLTKEGKLAHPLTITTLISGFAGLPDERVTINVDGSWRSECISKKKTSPKDKGQLTPASLHALAELLAKYDLKSLPAKSGEPGALPHTIVFEFGNTNSSLFGGSPPTADPNDGDVQSRFSRICSGVDRLLNTRRKGAEP